MIDRSLGSTLRVRSTTTPSVRPFRDGEERGLLAHLHLLDHQVSRGEMDIDPDMYVLPSLCVAKYTLTALTSG